MKAIHKKMKQLDPNAIPYYTLAIPDEDLEKIYKVCSRDWFLRKPESLVLWVYEEYEEQIAFMLNLAFGKDYTVDKDV